MNESTKQQIDLIRLNDKYSHHHNHHCKVATR